MVRIEDRSAKHSHNTNRPYSVPEYPDSFEHEHEDDASAEALAKEDCGCGLRRKLLSRTLRRPILSTVKSVFGFWG
jgi:hypothetical protein